MPAIISTGAQRAAKLARIAVGSQNLAMASWNVTVTGADLPTTNFESYNAVAAETFGEGIMGILEANGSYGGAWDAGGGGAGGSKFTANPPGLYPRDDLANVLFYVNRIDSTFWNFIYQRVRSVNISAAVEGLVLFNVSDFKNQGRFVLP